MPDPSRITERDLADHLDHSPQDEAGRILCRGKPLKAHEVVLLCITARAPRISRGFVTELFAPLVGRIMARWTPTGAVIIAVEPVEIR